MSTHEHGPESFQSAKPPRPPKGPRFRVMSGGEDPDDHGNIGRVQPHSIEAEEYFLACCLLDGAAMVSLGRSARLMPEAFYSPANRVIWEKLCEMSKLGLPIDLATVAEELRTSRQLDEIGGYAFLVQVSKLVPTTGQAAYFIDKVRELWLLREAIQIGSGLVERCYAYEGGGIGDALSKNVLRLQRLIDFADRAGRPDLAVRIAARREATLKAVAGVIDKSRWLYTGLAWLDACILPFDVADEDWQVIVAGPPSGGKSSFMRQIALHNIRQGKHGVVFLLETGLRWVEQAAASEARVNLRQKGQWTKDQAKRFEAAMIEIEGFAADGRLHVYEDIVYVEDIERVVREINRKLRDKQIAAGVPEDKARGLDFAVVDYLQIVATKENFRGNREQIVSHVSMSLKRLWKNVDITGFVGAQINRGARESGGPPTLAALRESGAIEQDADRVIFVHTPPENRAGNKQDGNQPVDEVEIIQGKSRNGPRDLAVGVLFEKQFTLYLPASGRGEARPGAPKPEGGFGREEGGRS